MTLTEPERQFLSRQRHGRLATVAPGGGPQVKPLGFTYNAELGTIDISGFNMGQSAKYRNIQTNPKVAFVVDEVVFEGIDGVRGFSCAIGRMRRRRPFGADVSRWRRSRR